VWGAAGAIHWARPHTALHVARDIGQGFSIEIFGAHTYTWSLFIFWVSVVTMGALLVLLGEMRKAEEPRVLGRFERLVFMVFLAVIAGNIVQAFASTGPPPFMGQSDPVRFSFNPAHWVWSTEEWSPSPVSLRGRWAIDKPDLTGVNPDPAAGPLGQLPRLSVASRQPLKLALRGTITGAAYDAPSDRFLLTTEQGVYLVDGSLGRILRYTVVDPGFSVDLGRFAGGTFLDPRTVMAIGENKSYVILREADRADTKRNFRYFLESFDAFNEVSRSRFATVRARMMYTMSLASDPASRSLYTVTVPNARVKRFVVSRFDRKDLTLSEEFMPVLAGDSGLAFSGGRRSLDEYYVTGLVAEQGRLYALSAAFSTLLVIDPAAHTIIAAYAIPGLDRPTGLAIKGPRFVIVDGNGSAVMVDRPSPPGATRPVSDAGE
jgi:disulfide bond formation protein DsbB